MQSGGRQKAWSNGVTLYGPTALGVTERQGGAKPPRRRARIPAAAETHGDDDGEDAARPAASVQEVALPEAEFLAAVQDRAERLVALLRGAELPLPRGLPQQGAVASEDNALLFVARHARMACHRGAEAAAPRIAFHWTAEGNFSSIVDSNLRVPDGAGVRKKHGAAFGRGIYASPDFHFAKEDFSYGALATFMCLVLPGRQEYRQPRSRNNLFDLPPEFDSIKGRLPGRPCDTWVFPASDQVCPCFLVDELALPQATEVLRSAIKLLNEAWPSAIAEGASAVPSLQPVGSGSSAALGSQAATAVYAAEEQPASAAAGIADGTNESEPQEALRPSGEPRGGRWRSQRCARADPDGLGSQGAEEGAATQAGEPGASQSTPSASSQPGKHRWRAPQGGLGRGAGQPARRPFVTVAGSLLEAEETLLVHQCCCVLNGPAAGLAAAVFERFPAADVYRQRRERGRPVDTPGRISVHGRVVNLYGQFCPGRPLGGRREALRSPYAECFARFPGVSDTREERLAWFREGLQRLLEALPAGAQRSVALPARIGCGLAAGQWQDYLGALHDFAAGADVLVAVYDREASVGHLSPATGQVAQQVGYAASVPVAPKPPARASFWDFVTFEFRSPSGVWTSYDEVAQAALRRALYGRSPSFTESRPVVALNSGPTQATAEVRLADVELGLGEHRDASTNSVLPVRLALPPVVSGELSIPAEIDDASDDVLPSQCGRILSPAEAVAQLPLADAACAMCTSGFDEDRNAEVCQLPCQHAFHETCLSRWFREKPECPTCKRRFGRIRGSQPRTGSMSWAASSDSLPGHPDCASVVLRFRFPEGTDAQGIKFAGRKERVFLPDDARGRLLLALFQLAFRRCVLFGLGVSMTLGIRRPTFNIHLKTSRKGGAARHGFPDDDYFRRAVDELRESGITLEQLE